MNPDSFQEAWQTQSNQKIDANMLVEQLKERQQQFSATLFVRDITEVVVALLMLPIWFALGYWIKLPWTWYLTVPVLLWIGGFMLVELLRRRRDRVEATASLRDQVELSLHQVEHQIRLLRSVFWWYLMPMAVSLLAFFGQVAWETHQRQGWLPAVLIFSLTAGFAAFIFASVYFANQRAVRVSLEPRRRELEEILQSLSDDPGSSEAARSPDHIV